MYTYTYIRLHRRVRCNSELYTIIKSSSRLGRCCYIYTYVYVNESVHVFIFLSFVLFLPAFLHRVVSIRRHERVSAIRLSFFSGKSVVDWKE